MRILVLPEDIRTQIRDIVRDTKDGLETGVSLFGVRVPRVLIRYCCSIGKNVIVYYYVVLAVAGPGPRATHRFAHYSSDTDYTDGIYQALVSALPAIQWLGELHLHPRGMTWLSEGDRRTVRDVLQGDPKATLSPSEFIAGVMQRCEDGVAIYPFHFSRDEAEEQAMWIKHVPANSHMVRCARDAAAGQLLPVTAKFDEDGLVYLPKCEPPNPERKGAEDTERGIPRLSALRERIFEVIQKAKNMMSKPREGAESK